MTRTFTAAAMIAAALLATAGFIALGAIFDYPAVLDQPAADVLAQFAAHQAAVSVWFGVLALAAALLAPIAVGVARLGANGLGVNRPRPAGADSPAAPGGGRSAGDVWLRRAMPFGVAAAVVQVVGLLRWPTLVPVFAAEAASTDPNLAAAGRAGFTTASTVLGTVVGETAGYLLSATWTLLVVGGLGRGYAGRWFHLLGLVSALLVVTGVLAPLNVPFADKSTFVGYVLWSVWLVWFGLLIAVRRQRSGRSTSQLAVAS